MQAIGHGAGGFFVYLLAVAITLRAADRMSPAVTAVAIAVPVYAVLLAVEARFYAPVAFWAVSISYWFWVACFLMLFGAVYKSVSLRILGDISTRPGRRMDQDQVARYVESESFDGRLKIMVDCGFAMATREGYELTPGGRRLAGIVSFLRRAFSIRKSG